MIDHLSNMISCINNGYSAKLTSVTIKTSKLCLNVLDTLERGGYIKGYKYVPSMDTESNRSPIEQKTVQILLRYQNNKAAIVDFKRVSSSGRRIYLPYTEINNPNQGLGSYILSTSKGVMLDYEARILGVGGEVICILL